MSDTDGKVPTNGKSTNGDPANGKEKVTPPAGERVGFGSGRMPSAGIPMEKSLNFGPSVKRLLRRMGPDRRLLGVVFVLAVVGVTLVSRGTSSPASCSAPCSACAPTSKTSSTRSR